MLAGFADEQLEVLFETAERFRVALGVFFLFVVVAEFNDDVIGGFELVQDRFPSPFVEKTF